MPVWWYRLLNRLPHRRTLIARMASQEWEQQQIVDQVLGMAGHPYEPGAWWRLRSR